MAQMFVTCCVIAFCMAYAQEFILYGGGWALGIPLMIIALICEIAIFCCKGVRR